MEKIYILSFSLATNVNCFKFLIVYYCDAPLLAVNFRFLIHALKENSITK